MTDSAIHMLISVIIGIACIAIAIQGNPGSMLGSLIDAQAMELTSGGGAVGSF